jgi:hypothetical protein
MSAPAAVQAAAMAKYQRDYDEAVEAAADRLAMPTGEALAAIQHSFWSWQAERAAQSAPAEQTAKSA